MSNNIIVSGNNELLSESQKSLRDRAILACYGVKAYEENLTINFDDEEIIGWMINGCLNLEDAQAIFTDEQIIDIYDSGL